MMQAFDDAMEEEYGHLCLDFSPGCNSITRVTSNWFSYPPALNSYLYKTDAKSPSIKMSSKAFTKLLLIPQARYLKLISNDPCGCKFIARPPHSNALHTTRNIPGLPSVGFDSKIRNSAPENRKENERTEGSVESGAVGREDFKCATCKSL